MSDLMFGLMSGSDRISTRPRDWEMVHEMRVKFIGPMEIVMVGGEVVLFGLMAHSR